MTGTYRFGTFEIDTARSELRRSGAPVEVQPKVLDLIVHLIERRERIVTRQELLDELWADAIVSEGVLTTAIHAARSALDDTASRAWAIKTIARRGYRFVAPVSEKPRSPASMPEVVSASHVADWAGDTFVGRERCLARIDSAFRAAAAGRGRVLTISGESGIGKTRVLDEMMVRAAHLGAHALVASCDAREGAPAYAPWVEIVGRIVTEADPADAMVDLGAGAADLVALVPAVRDLCPDLPAPPRLQSDTSRFRLFESIRIFVGHTAERRPILILLDDLQIADHASLRLLAYLAREIRHLRILMLVTLRENAGDFDPVLEETLAELARQFPGERIALEGLSHDEIGTIVSNLMGGRPSDELVEAILTRSEGNPFFVKEIVGLLDASAEAQSESRTGRAEATWASEIPPGVRDVILGRLHRRSEPCQQLLRSASVLGREFRLGVLARLVDREPFDLTNIIAEACATGFLREDPADVDRHHFSHGLLHETIYDSTGSAQRKRLHLRAGQVLESRGSLPVSSSPADLALHFLRAGDDRSLAKAVEYAASAAEQASLLYAHDEAVEHYGMALDALERMTAPDEVQRCELLTALGAAQLGARAGDPRGRDSLLRAAEIAHQIGEPLQLAKAALEVSAITLHSGPGDVDITRILEAGLDGIGESDDVLRARLMASLAFQLRGSDDHERSVSLSNDAVALARKRGHTVAICEALSVRCAIQSGPDQLKGRLRDADELLVLAGEADVTELGLFGYRWRLVAMLELGDMGAAERELAAYDAAADRGRVWSARWYGLTLRAARALAEARFDAAERMVVESFAHRRDVTTPLIIGTFATQLFWLRREQGRLEEVSHLRRYDSPHLTFRVLQVLLDAELGNEEASLEKLRETVATKLDTLVHDFTFLYIVSVLAETCLALGDESSAPHIYKTLLPHANQPVILLLGSVQLGSTSLNLGRLAALMGDFEGAESHFVDALAANEHIGAHLWVARTRLAWAAMLAAEGGVDARRAREVLRPCLADAHERGMAVVARRAMDLMDRLPG